MLGGQARVRLVQVVGRADDERVDARVGRRRLVGAEGREPPEAPPVRLRPRRIAAGECDSHRAAEPPGGASVKGREPAASHEAQTQRTGSGPSAERSDRRAAARVRGRHVAHATHPSGAAQRRIQSSDMRRVAVVGLGVTKFGKHERTCAELFAEAGLDALIDAGDPPPPGPGRLRRQRRRRGGRAAAPPRPAGRLRAGHSRGRGHPVRDGLRLEPRGLPPRPLRDRLGRGGRAPGGRRRAGPDDAHRALDRGVRLRLGRGLRAARRA